MQTNVQVMPKKKLKVKRSASTNRKRHRLTGPRNSSEFFALTEAERDRLHTVAHVVSRVRDGKSLREAAKEFNINPKTAVRLAGSALQKKSNGRYAARKSDRLIRVLTTLTQRGTEEIVLRDSRVATTLAEYWEAVRKYLQTGDATGLSKYRGKTITDADGKKTRLITNTDELNRLGSAGVLSFESLYARSA